MIGLSIKDINRKSGYNVTQTENEGFFKFFTGYGVHYSVGFMPDDCLLSEDAYHLIIANVNNRKSPRDIKVRDTVLSIVDEFFEKNNTTLLYIYVKLETENSQCAKDYLSIGFPHINIRTTSHSCHHQSLIMTDC